MTEDTQERVEADDILDSVTLKIAKTLLENPKIQYNKTTLAKAAGVSKDALYSRWNSLVKGGLIEKAEVESEVEHWQLNQDTSSPLPEALGQIMYVVGNVQDNRWYAIAEYYDDYEEALHFEGDFMGEPIITKARIHDNGDIQFHQGPKTGDKTFLPDDIVGFGLEELKEVVEKAEQIKSNLDGGGSEWV